MKRYLLIIGLMMIAVWGKGQVTAPEQLNIAPVIPNTASLGKFGDIPVSLYTGVPLLIWICTAGGDLQLAIIISRPDSVNLRKEKTLFSPRFNN